MAELRAMGFHATGQGKSPDPVLSYSTSYTKARAAGGVSCRIGLQDL